MQCVFALHLDEELGTNVPIMLPGHCLEHLCNSGRPVEIWEQIGNSDIKSFGRSTSFATFATNTSEANADDVENAYVRLCNEMPYNSAVPAIFINSNLDHIEDLHRIPSLSVILESTEKTHPTLVTTRGDRLIWSIGVGFLEEQSAVLLCFDRTNLGGPRQRNVELWLSSKHTPAKFSGPHPIGWHRSEYQHQDLSPPGFRGSERFASHRAATTSSVWRQREQFIGHLTQHEESGSPAKKKVSLARYEFGSNWQSLIRLWPANSDELAFWRKENNDEITCVRAVSFDELFGPETSKGTPCLLYTSPSPRD